MGTAREPVVGSACCPACTASVARCGCLLSDIDVLLQIRCKRKARNLDDRRPNGNLIWVLLKPIGWSPGRLRRCAYCDSMGKREGSAVTHSLGISIKPRHIGWQVAWEPASSPPPTGKGAPSRNTREKA